MESIAYWPFSITQSGVIQIGDKKLPCAVLANGQRVLSENAITNAILGGRSGASKRLKKRGAPSPIFLAPSNLTHYISKEMIDGPLRVIEYEDGDRTVHGFDATLLPLVCDVWLKARADNALQQQQLDKAMTAEILIRNLAKVSIIALVDEATGYQYERARNALADILEAFIAKELADWAKTFDDEFYREICATSSSPRSSAPCARPEVLPTSVNSRAMVRAYLPRGLGGRFVTASSALIASASTSTRSS